MLSVPRPMVVPIWIKAESADWFTYRPNLTCLHAWFWASTKKKCFFYPPHRPVWCLKGWRIAVRFRGGDEIVIARECGTMQDLELGLYYRVHGPGLLMRRRFWVILERQ